MLFQVIPRLRAAMGLVRSPGQPLTFRVMGLFTGMLRLDRRPGREAGADSCPCVAKAPEPLEHLALPGSVGSAEHTAFCNGCARCSGSLYASCGGGAACARLRLRFIEQSCARASVRQMWRGGVLSPDAGGSRSLLQLDDRYCGPPGYVGFSWHQRARRLDA